MVAAAQGRRRPRAPGLRARNARGGPDGKRSLAHGRAGRADAPPRSRPRAAGALFAALRGRDRPHGQPVHDGAAWRSVLEQGPDAPGLDWAVSVRTEDGLVEPTGGLDGVRARQALPDVRPAARAHALRRVDARAAAPPRGRVRHAGQRRVRAGRGPLLPLAVPAARAGRSGRRRKAPARRRRRRRRLLHARARPLGRGARHRLRRLRRSARVRPPRPGAPRRRLARASPASTTPSKARRSSCSGPAAGGPTTRSSA